MRAQFSHIFSRKTKKYCKMNSLKSVHQKNMKKLSKFPEKYMLTTYNRIQTFLDILTCQIFRDDLNAFPLIK